MARWASPARAMAFDRYRTPLVFALALILPAVVYRAQTRRPDQVNLLDRAVLFVTTPIQEASVRLVGGVADLWRGYVDVVGARKREAELRRALSVARRRNAGLELLEVENQHLRALLDLEQANPGRGLVAARVVGAGLDPSTRVLRVDRGSLDRLHRGDPVIAGQGLVGRVLEVGWSSADVQLLADPRVSVQVKVARSGARGRLQGEGRGPEFALLLSEVLRSDDIREGDRVVTSGLGGIYPPGIPVGVVTRLFTEPGVPHRFAEVAPYVDFARLELLEVVTSTVRDSPLVTPEPLLPPALRAPAEDRPR